jgi:tripartite-type tricarboxylate transporter receptor subunit TctC
MRTRDFAAGLLALGLMAFSSSVQAQSDYPAKQITIVIPFAPGGITDVQTRAVAAGLERVLKQPIAIENKPGASGQVGTQAVASAAPDGYTLVVAGSSSFVSAPALKTNLTYDPVKDFRMVAIVAQVPLFLAVPADSGIADMKEFVEYVKKNSGQIKFGTAGLGASSHITAARFMRLLGVDATVIPFNGSSPALIELSAGRLNFVIDSPGAIAPHLESGRVKLLAVFAQSRVENFADVPTIAEAGFPEAMDDTWEFWQGFAAPAGTPDAILQKLNAAVNEASGDPVIASKLLSLGLVPVHEDVDYAQKRLEGDVKTVVPLLATLGFKAQ